MDNCCNIDSSLAVGFGYQLHDGWNHPYPSGDCHYCCGGRLHPGETRVGKQVPLSHESEEKREV